MRGDWKLFGEASGELLSDLKECMGRPCLGHWAALNTSTNIVASMTSSIFIDPLAHVWAIRCLLANLLSPEILGWFSAESCCAALTVPKTACVSTWLERLHRRNMPCSRAATCLQHQFRQVSSVAACDLKPQVRV